MAWVSRTHTAMLAPPPRNAEATPLWWLPGTCVPGQCLPARAPGSGHRLGDRHEPLPPGPRDVPLPVVGLVGNTASLPWPQWTVPSVRLGGIWQRERGLRSLPSSPSSPGSLPLSPLSPCPSQALPLSPGPSYQARARHPQVLLVQERIALCAGTPRPSTGAVAS